MDENKTLREELIEMLENEPERFAKWLDNKLSDATNVCCAIRGNCTDNCVKCINKALDEPRFVLPGERF